MAMPACSPGRRRHERVPLRAPRERRGGPPRPAADRAWAGRDAGLHAGRHGGHGQGDDARHAARDRRPDGPRQRLPPDAAAGRRADRAPGRPPPLHGLAGADPDRFRRLPGHVAGGAPDHRRAGRRLRLPPRRQPPRAHARARDRGPGPARCDRDHGPRRMHPLADRAPPPPPPRCAARCAGPVAAGAPFASARATACSASSRAAFFPNSGSSPPKPSCRRASMATRSAALRSASRRPGCSKSSS